MQEKEMVAKGLEWIIHHKEMLYKRNKDFEDNELDLLNKTSLLIDRVLIIHKSKKYSATPLMLGISSAHLGTCWDYMTDEEWKSLIDKFIAGLSEWKDAVESEDKESLYESMLATISYTGNALIELAFSGKRKTTPEEWETEETIDERIDSVEEDLEEIKKKLDRQEKISEFFFSRIK